MVVALVVACASARAATLPNELPDTEIAVVARGVCGPFFRPGAWTALRFAVENTGDPFLASVRVREKRGGAEAYFVAARRVELRRGTNSFDVLVAPGDPSAGTALEIMRLTGGTGEVVFRGALSRILRPLARGERLIVTVGATAVPLRADERTRVWALTPREMPTSPEAWGSVDVLVIGSAPHSAVSRAQVRAAADYVLGGGRIVFASIRALNAFWRAISGTGTKPPRSVVEFHAVCRTTRVVAGTETDPRVIELPLGLGRCAVHAGRPDGKFVAELAKLLGRPRAGMFIDAAAFGALEVDRPFARGAMRARTVAIVGALIVTVCAALLARRSRRVAGGVIGAAAVAWAAVALLAWEEPVAAARIIRVRAFSADGRAETVTDTATLLAFDRDTTLAFETETAPPLPVARRPGRAFAEPFVLEKREGGAGAWRLSSLSVYPDEAYIVRATSAREVGHDGERVRAHVLANGARVRVTPLPGGGRKLSAAGELPRDVRYLLERFAPRCAESDELAWVWVEGAPEEAHAPKCDTSPGSGTLVIAALPMTDAPD